MINLIIGIVIGFILGIVTTIIYFYRKIRKFNVGNIMKANPQAMGFINEILKPNMEEEDEH